MVLILNINNQPINVECYVYIHLCLKIFIIKIILLYAVWCMHYDKIKQFCVEMSIKSLNFVDKPLNVKITLIFALLAICRYFPVKYMYVN